MAIEHYFFFLLILFPLFLVLLLLLLLSKCPIPIHKVLEGFSIAASFIQLSHPRTCFRQNVSRPWWLRSAQGCDLRHANDIPSPPDFKFWKRTFLFSVRSLLVRCKPETISVPSLCYREEVCLQLENMRKMHREEEGVKNHPGWVPEAICIPELPFLWRIHPFLT